MLIDHAIWWHVYPLGAVGAPVHDPDEPGEHHRLRRLEAWLDYAIELGCSGLLLAPIFESSSHGYDTLDHFRIDPRLGDDADFDHLMEAARQRGLLVMLDGVFNHVGRDHPLAASMGTSSGWEGHDSLIELDHANPAVADLVVEVMLHWLRRGIVGWRLDVAYAVPAEFWRTVLPRVRAEFPDAVFLGEVIHGEYDQIMAESTLDTVTQYELWKAIWSSLHDANFWELAWSLERHDQFSADHVLNTFVGNHDVDRIASVVGDDGAALAAVLLLTLPGMPSIYYGDEQGFRGTKTEGFRADDPLRPELPDDPAQLAGVGAWLHQLYQHLIGLRRRHSWLTRARVKVLDKQNEQIHYECVGAAGERLEAEVRLEPVASAVVRVEGETFTWTAE
ncbi:alpha-amylase family protein [Aestuariimicrobium sp. Y1814]|uniref:alpha-amylase family protein n=1 Tax=Aestuariimicrobium sp. Y1814 TaxID=3418742 RepID=UPI003DA73520